MTHPIQKTNPRSLETVLRAKLRMAYFLLLLFLIHIIEAAVTFPFVDHTTRTQNVIYGFIVAAPFYTICILYILLVRGDLAAARRETP